MLVQGLTDQGLTIEQVNGNCGVIVPASLVPTRGPKQSFTLSLIFTNPSGGTIDFHAVGRLRVGG